MGTPMFARWRGWPWRMGVLVVVGCATVVGGALILAGIPSGLVAWLVATVIALVFAVAVVVRDLRAGHLGVDVIAVLALAGSLLTGEYLAGALIGLMLATGQVLEDYAQRRAHRDLSALLDRTPRTAHVRRGDAVDTVPVATVVPGDLLLVRSGEIVPADGRLIEPALFDESALTGEPLPVQRDAGDLVRSGVVNAGAAATIRVLRGAEDSTYAGVVRLAEQAGARAAPIVRLADRFAAGFLPLVLVIAGVAWWWSGDPVRAVAVLVTATPCPLLLAVPVAITSGMSAASRHGVVVKDGATLERLGRSRIALLDKTGTVTEGTPRVTEVTSAPGTERLTVLALAAAIERYSPHVLATAVVRAADRAGAPSLDARDVVDHPGVGAVGMVGDQVVTVGRVSVSEDGCPRWVRVARRRAALDAAGVVWVSVDGALAGALLVRDEVRPDAARTLSRLRAAGLGRLLLVTGDRREAAEDIAGLLGFDVVVAECAPEDKVDRVRAERRTGVTVVVGDGINDAPALAAADVGVALGARGATAATQVADAVLTDDRIDGLADAVEIARRARRIAEQSAEVGIALSLLAMAVAAVGWLQPAAGALVQEAIDVVVILNALRALRQPRRSRLPVSTAELIRRFAAEHVGLAQARAAVRDAADALSAGTTPQAVAAVRHAHRMLTEQLLPHERAEEAELYPAVEPVVGGRDGVAPMSRGHAEIERLARRLSRHLADPGAPRPDQVDDLRATLYGLDAVLTLHFAQEEQGYFTLAEPAGQG